MLCSLCAHGKEMERWRAEFAKEKQEAEALGECQSRLQQLLAIHKQPWIQAAADDVFGA